MGISCPFCDWNPYFIMSPFCVWSNNPGRCSSTYASKNSVLSNLLKPFSCVIDSFRFNERLSLGSIPIDGVSFTEMSLSSSSLMLHVVGVNGFISVVFSVVLYLVYRYSEKLSLLMSDSVCIKFFIVVFGVVFRFIVSFCICCLMFCVFSCILFITFCMGLSFCVSIAVVFIDRVVINRNSTTVILNIFPSICFVTLCILKPQLFLFNKLYK